MREEAWPRRGDEEGWGRGGDDDFAWRRRSRRGHGRGPGFPGRPGFPGGPGPFHFGGPWMGDQRPGELALVLGRHGRDAARGVLPPLLREPVADVAAQALD